MKDLASSAAEAANSRAKKGRGSLTATNMGMVNDRAKKAGHGKGTKVMSSMPAAKAKKPMLKSKKK